MKVEAAQRTAAGKLCGALSWYSEPSAGCGCSPELGGDEQLLSLHDAVCQHPGQRPAHLPLVLVDGSAVDVPVASLDRCNHSLLHLPGLSLPAMTAFEPLLRPTFDIRQELSSAGNVLAKQTGGNPATPARHMEGMKRSAEQVEDKCPIPR